MSMRNVFLVYMPPGNPEAMVHYQDTILSKVPLARIAPLIPTQLRQRLTTIFGMHPLSIWGSAPGERNRLTFDRMSEGDDLLIIEGKTIRLLGKIAAKVAAPQLSRELWKPLTGGSTSSWELIYFIANPREINVPFDDFKSLMGYEPTFRLRGLTAVKRDRIEAFYQRFDDLYSVLVRRERGEIAVEWIPLEEPREGGPDPGIQAPAMAAREETESPGPEVSDHVRMQWKLARLGNKAGERVWVPAGDQARLRRHYEYEEFDAEFSAGIDLPHSYVENIDVVWTQEFRIDAAYEIENSTSIYSGLLRFADLMILAPNTIYPLFVVAPSERKNRLREQLRRPTFKQMRLQDKVRFLSYEAVDEIDRFFADSDAGLNVDVVISRSEKVA